MTESKGIMTTESGQWTPGLELEGACHAALLVHGPQPGSTLQYFRLLSSTPAQFIFFHTYFHLIIIHSSSSFRMQVGVEGATGADIHLGKAEDLKRKSLQGRLGCVVSACKSRSVVLLLFCLLHQSSQGRGGGSAPQPQKPSVLDGPETAQFP